MIELPRAGTRLDPAAMPELTAKVGHDIVTSSGDTLLGADDKAGVAEIMAAVAHLAAHPELPRPTLRIAFTPDEEIGEGATLFDIERFGALCAYTIDGSELGELQDETFSAVEAIVTVDGVDVHPGQATGKLVNALRLAAEIVAAAAADRLTPETTSGREGFIHLYELTGTAGGRRDPAIVRDFDEDAARRARRPARAHRPRGGRRAPRGPRSTSRCAASTATCASTSTRSRASSRPPRRRSAPRGSSRSGRPIRGGTDGSRLSEMGLPTPNIFTGGHEYHSVREWASRAGHGRGGGDDRPPGRGVVAPGVVRARRRQH